MSRTSTEITVAEERQLTVIIETENEILDGS